VLVLCLRLLVLYTCLFVKRPAGIVDVDGGRGWVFPFLLWEKTGYVEGKKNGLGNRVMEKDCPNDAGFYFLLGLVSVLFVVYAFCAKEMKNREYPFPFVLDRCESEVFFFGLWFPDCCIEW
jgi:hypothetical protein